MTAEAQISNANLVHCYNKGCGKLFDVNKNSEGKFLKLFYGKW